MLPHFSEHDRNHAFPGTEEVEAVYFGAASDFSGLKGARCCIHFTGADL
jgi:hypothetical protein